MKNRQKKSKKPRWAALIIGNAEQDLSAQLDLVRKNLGKLNEIIAMAPQVKDQRFKLFDNGKGLLLRTDAMDGGLANAVAMLFNAMEFCLSSEEPPIQLPPDSVVVIEASGDKASIVTISGDKLVRSGKKMVLSKKLKFTTP